jgi:hypothetical protein
MNLPDLRLLFIDLYNYSSIPVILIGLYCLKKLSKEVKYLLMAFIINYSIAVFSNLTLKWNWQNNLFLNHLATINDGIFMTLFFYLIIKDRTIKKYVSYIGILIFSMCILDAIWITGYQNPNSLSGSIETFCVLCINVYYLIKLIQNHDGTLFISSLFWANTAIFLNNSFPIFQQLFNEQLYLYSSDLFFQFDIFNKFMLIIANLFYALAFWYAKPKTQTL